MTTMRDNSLYPFTLLFGVSFFFFVYTISIVHPCCHPEDGSAPANETEMMNAIFAYIDRIVAMIRPRKLLYMAIDGVAPRAKMNQQRSRRFRAAQEAELYREASIRNDGDAGRDQKVEGLLAKEHFDSNVITPGTAFMLHLGDALRFYINQRLSNVEGWSQLQDFLAEASLLREGEHKIMQYIRLQRLSISHDPNTKHVLYGLVISIAFFFFWFCQSSLACRHFISFLKRNIFYFLSLLG